MHKKSVKRFSLNTSIKSFRYAFSGLSSLIRNEPNAIVHLAILVIVIIAGIFFRISKSDWIAIAIVASMVFTSECFNTGIEYLSDFISPEHNDKIKNIKDIASAGVLVSAIGSVVAGVLIFLPELIKLFN